MQYAHAYTRPYSDTSLKDLKSRHAQWDKRSQYHSVIKGSTGNRMPFYVKFPRVSETFENLPPGNRWAKNRLGKYNGLYYVPDNPHTHSFRVDDVKFGEKDIREEFFNSPEYKLLQYSMQRCYRKLHVTGARTVTLERQEYSFQDDPELFRKGKLVFKHDNI